MQHLFFTVFGKMYKVMTDINTVLNVSTVHCCVNKIISFDLFLAFSM